VLYEYLSGCRTAIEPSVRDYVLHSTMHGDWTPFKPTGAFKLGGGDVSGGETEMQLTGDKDLDRARDHVLHGTRHGASGEILKSQLESQFHSLGGGDVSHGKPDMELTGDKDLDWARDYVLHSTMHGDWTPFKPTGAFKLGGGDVSGGETEMQLTGDKDLDRARDHVLHGTRHGASGEILKSQLESQFHSLGGGDVSHGKPDTELTGDNRRRQRLRGRQNHRVYAGR
jgi:hypothetical protein